MSNAEPIRVRLVMSREEYAALLTACECSLRTPDAEARYILRQELQRLGLLDEVEERNDPTY